MVLVAWRQRYGVRSAPSAKEQRDLSPDPAEGKWSEADSGGGVQAKQIHGWSSNVCEQRESK
jgi:hypothetical protein